MTVRDPALRPSGNPDVRGFNDILRRARDLNAVCASQLRNSVKH